MTSNQAEKPAYIKLHNIFTVVFLGVAAGLQLVDIGLQAVSLSAIQASFRISDTSLGALQGLAGILIGSALAIPLARFADNFSRKRVLFYLLLAASAMMLLSAFASSFPLFFIGRSAAGITEFAMVPLVYSMIPDLVPERNRVASNLMFAALMAIGASGGFYFSSNIIALADSWFIWDMAAWRKGFLLVALAGAPLLILCLFTKDPPRSKNTVEQDKNNSLLPYFRRNWLTMVLFVGTAGCLMVAVQSLNQLMTIAFERRFSASPEIIGNYFGIIILITSLGCLPIAGFTDRMLSKYVGNAVRPLIMGVSVLLSIPIILLLLSVNSLNNAFIIVGVFLFLTCTANALVPTMLQDIAPPNLRARIFAIWSFVVSLFSAAGPLLAGSLSDLLFDNHMLNAIVAVAIPALFISLVCASRSFIDIFKQFKSSNINVV